MQHKTIEHTLNNLHESYHFGDIARQANGSVLYRQKKAVLLATVTMEEKTVNEPFVPLTVQYIEKAYAAAKIPGGFVKRESKPSDFETLTSRLIDRSLRPLFPEGFSHPVVIDVLVLSSDAEVDLPVAALHAANAALLLSDIPVERSVAAVRIGKGDEGVIYNPAPALLEEGSLDLLLVGSGEDLMMVEMAARPTERIDEEELEEATMDAVFAPAPLILPHQESNELPEAELLEYVEEGLRRIADACRAYEESFLPLKKTPRFVEVPEIDPDVRAFLADNLRGKIDMALEGLSKSERGTELHEIRLEAEELIAHYGREIDEVELLRTLDDIVKEAVREQILGTGRRADGRDLQTVRPIAIETNLLPSVHGSCLFTRGETQVLATVTLGEAKDAQIFELLSDKGPRSERFMVHYNFPPFCVGEARPIGAPSRRELGHGNLAKRALEPVVDRLCPHTVRLVSEVLESNGSSSMATVCAGSLALASAEVGIASLVAGVAMGLVRDGERYAILTDIMGIEDRYGDMDFKIAGTRNGITALQMDVKGGGLDPAILREALDQAAQARNAILDRMEEAQKGIVPSQALPVSEHFHIDPSRIVHIIGKAGSTIKEIIQRFDVRIDLDRQKGGVRVTGSDRENVRAAREHIHGIVEASKEAEREEVSHYEVGKRYKGVVRKIVDYGVFVELPGSHQALLHISKIARERISDLAERFRSGEEIEVVVLSQEGRKVELATPEWYEANRISGD
ncbi:polyribonucleotide nucleotidyltransferase [Nitratifractor sp.]